VKGDKLMLIIDFLIYLKKEPLIFQIIAKSYRLFAYNFGSVLLFLLILAPE
jgi:hypothetical protein